MNNLAKLEKFFSETSSNNLLINFINEEINLLYLFFIKHFANKNNYLINLFDTNKTNGGEIDIFNQKKITIYNETNQKKIDGLLLQALPKIIFIDYKNFKRLCEKQLNINTYQYKSDIKIFVSNEYNINSSSLFENIFENPYLIYSELSKFRVNQSLNPNSLNSKTKKENNFNRTDYYKLKNSQGLDLIKLYHHIKNETLLKKFNFLTY